MSARTTRRSLLRSGALAAAMATIAEPGAAEAATLHRDDVAILQFALLLEQLQAAFYTEAERAGALHGQTADLARVVGAHERAHVQAIHGALGARAAAAPMFDFKGATETPGRFVRTAVAFEDLGVAAYKGQLARIRSDRVVATVLSIHAVEARHAAWIRRLAGVVPAPAAFDKAKPEDVIKQIVRSTRFVVSSTSHQSPGFTG